MELSVKDNRVARLELEISKLKSAVKELTVLNDLAIAASSSLEVDKVLDIIVQKSIKAVMAEQGTIMLVTRQVDTPLKTLIRQGDKSAGELHYRVGNHITGWVLKHQQPLMIEDLASDQRFQASDQEKNEIRSVLCVPIWCKGQIIGILMMTNKRGGETFNSNDLRLISIIAAQSGQLIRNSQLQTEAIEKKQMEQEMDLARKIQMSLLPSEEPRDALLDIASYFNPTKAVGGDYYDYFHLNNNRLGVVISDVVGHGPSAAMMMTMVKGILHTINQNFTSPDVSLQELNTILSQILPREIFITMQFLVFDPQRRILVFSNAGHNPMLYYNHEKKTCQLIKLSGCALNLTAQSTFTITDFPLNEGDLFFIYTDGVTEAMNEKLELFEDDRLIRVIGDSATQTASGIIQQVRFHLNEFTRSRPQDDDIAMIAIKIK